MRRSIRMILGAGIGAASVLGPPSTLAATTRTVKAAKAGCTVIVNELKLASEGRIGFLEEFGSVRCSRTQRHVTLKGEIDRFVPQVWVPAFATFPPYTIIAGRVDRFRFRIPCGFQTKARVRATLTLHPRGGAVARIRTPFLYGTFDCPSPSKATPLKAPRPRLARAASPDVSPQRDR